MCTSLLGDIPLFFMLPTFIWFMIDSVGSISKLIVYPQSLPMIVTPYSCSVISNCFILHGDSFIQIYCATGEFVVFICGVNIVVSTMSLYIFYKTHL